MADSGPHRASLKRRGRIILAILAALPLSAGLAFWDIHRRAAASIERHEREVALLFERLHAESSARPVVLGESEDGNAWDLYRRAFAGLQRMTSAEMDAIPELSGDEVAPDDQQIGVIVAAYDAELELLRRAVRQREVDPGAVPDGWTRVAQDLVDSVRAKKFLAGAARYHHRTGNDGEAMDLTLLGLAMAQDLSRRFSTSGVAYGCVGESIACATGQQVLGEHALDSRQLERLAQFLDRLLSARPSLVDALPWEELFLRKLLVKSGKGEVELASPTWRQLWSRSILAGQALQLASDYFLAARALERVAPHKRIEASAALVEQFGSDNVAMVAVPSLTGLSRMDATASWKSR
jgi:hypothetical protein